MPKTRKFIDKKKAVTFQLVHRSQQDPLIADENAPQRVLLPISNTDDVKGKQVEEQHNYGIFYNDDCNYLEYLKDSKDNQVEWPEHVDGALHERKVKLQLPPSVFASKNEEKEGMLSLAAPVSGPQLHLDPDLVAAMDDDFDYFDPENQLEDNFIQLADGVASDQEFDEEFNMESDFSDEERDEVGSLKASQHSFEEEETKSRFTNYSMTSSVMRRNEQLTLLDDRFEQMYAGYDENEIGALDCEEIEGYVDENSDMLLQYAEEFKKGQAKEHLDKELIVSKISNLSDDESDTDKMVYIEVPEKEKWDCESILSTYSNIYNHPKLIKEPPSQKIQVDGRTGIPCNVIDSNKLTKKALERLGEEHQYYEDKGPKSVGVHSVISKLSTLSVRPKGEDPEQRKERKKLLKEFKRERRLEKKANTLAFKEETKRQIKINLNNRNNVQGNRIL